MDHQRIIRNILIGKANYLESRVAYKSAMLRGYMAIIALLVGVSYTIIDHLNDIHINIPYYIAVIVLASVTIALNRRKRYTLASVVFLLSINLIIFLFATSDTYRSGVYIFFICSSLSAFALFGHRQVRYAFLFSMLSLVLFIVAYWGKQQLIPTVPFTEEYLQINFTTNFITALITCLSIVYFLLDINHMSEEKLLSTAHELQKSRERNEMVVEAANAGIYEWLGAEQSIFISPTWKKLLGYNETELENISIELYLSMIHPEDVEGVNMHMADHFKNRLPYANEYRLRTKHGDFFWFIDSGYSKFDNEGKPVITVGSIINIHERKVAEDKILNQNRLLAKANDELDRFVYSVSHDLRAPLSSILGLTNVYTLSTSADEKESIVRLISDRANTLDAFIREILDYSRNSRRTLKLQPVNIKNIIDEVTEEINHMKGFDRLRLNTNINPDIEVVTDRDRLKVVLNNLITNAVKYSDYGKDSFIHITSSVGADHWSISIEDNGIGIKPEHHERIFDMFYQAHDHSQGSGLGLYIVKETVQRLNGEIQMSSVYGTGTTFSLVMPSHPILSDAAQVLVAQ